MYIVNVHMLIIGVLSIYVEKLQACSQTEELSIADLANTELQAQLEDLGIELDKRYNKKQKYKQMYLVGESHSFIKNRKDLTTQ